MLPAFAGWLAGGGGLLGLAAPPPAQAADLPADKAEALYHVYDGGGVEATGPALLVRKRLSDRWSVQASYYVDAVSNASIDVVTTASPFKERRQAIDLGVDHLVRNGTVALGVAYSKEPDYTAQAVSVDLAQDVFGGMTTVGIGFTRGQDDVFETGSPEFGDQATHWRWRAGVTQVLTPRWLASLNFEAVSDSGFLGSPYRVAYVYGAAVPERVPRTRTSRSVQLGVAGDLGARDALHASARWFADTWDIQAGTLEAGYSRYFGDRWLVDAWLRGYTQSKALFYSDNATEETLYISRNRQLSTFDSSSLGARATYAFGKVGERFDVRFVASLERIAFRYRDFTDIRTGKPYSFDATLLQAFASATF
jgi:hypothetical protein